MIFPDILCIDKLSILIQAVYKKEGQQDLKNIIKTKKAISLINKENGLSFMCYGGEDGIRTHVGLHPNGFQDRPVMTASVPLQDKITFVKFLKRAYHVTKIILS